MSPFNKAVSKTSEGLKMWSFSCPFQHTTFKLETLLWSSDAFLTSKRSSVPKPPPVSSCFPAKLSPNSGFEESGTAGGKYSNKPHKKKCRSAGMSTEVNCTQKRPTRKIHRSEICGPNLDKHAVLRGAWYANSFVKSLKAERLIQQPALLRRAETLLRHTRLRFTFPVVTPQAICWSEKHKWCILPSATTPPEIRCS